MTSKCFIDAFAKENGKIFWGDQYTFNCLRAAAEDKTDEELVTIMLAQKEKKETPKKISSDPHVNMMGAKRAQYKAIRSKYQNHQCDECLEELTQAGWKPTKPISEKAKERAKTYKKIKAKYEDTSCDECVKELTEAGWKPKKAPKSDDEKEKELRAQLNELEAKKAQSDTEEKCDDSDSELKKETFEDSDNEKPNDSDEEKPEEKPKSEDLPKKVKLSAEEREAKKAEKEAKKAEKDAKKAKKAEKDAKKTEKDAKKTEKDAKKTEKDTKASESSDEE